MVFDLFKKKGDVIDYSELNRRGLLKKQEQKINKTVDKYGYADLGKTGMAGGGVVEATAVPESVSTDSGFLSGLASLGSSETSSSVYSSSYSESSFPSGSDDFANSIPNENFETSEDERKKRFAKRIKMMSDKVDENDLKMQELEKRIEALERKVRFGN